MRIFTKLGIAFLLTVFATGMLWAQTSEMDAAKIQAAEEISGQVIDADITPMSGENMKSMSMGTDDTDVVGGTTNAYNAGPRARGNAYYCSEDRTLVEFMGWHDVSTDPTQMWMLVYEGEAAEGDYTLVSSTDITPAPVGLGWVSSGVIDFPLVAGKYYLLLASFEQACGYYADPAVTPFPYPVAFGEAIGGAGYTWAPSAVFPPDETVNVPAGSWVEPVLYHQQIVTEPAVTYADDLSVQAISSPNSGVYLGMEDVTATIKNYGTNAQTDIEVSYTLDGGAAVVETISGTLNQGETIEYTFATQVDLSAIGTYVIEVCTTLGDENPGNDCKTKDVENSDPSLCTPVYTSGCTFGDGFTDFALAEIENYGSGCGDLNGVGWSQYLELGPAMLEPGMSYTITMATGYANNFTTVWIDFNDDLVLSEDEKVVDNFEMAIAAEMYEVTIDIPADAMGGEHIMRARTNWAADCLDPCASYSYGEAEDYTVSVGGGVEYCEAWGNCDEFLSNIMFGDIDNTSDCDASAYSDFTAISTDIAQGETYTMQVTTGNFYAADDYGVWIDWNQNGDFYDAGENVVCEFAVGAEINTFDIAVPADAALGDTRMRIRLKYSGDDCGDPCGESAWGEVEDYMVNVTEGGGTTADCDDFDDLTVGGYVADQLGGLWTTWSGAPATAEDGLVSDMYSTSPSNSILVEGTTDLVKMFAEENITSGSWSFTHNIYVPTGTTGYWNLQKDVVTGTEWGFQVMLDDDMTMIIDAGAAAAAVIPYEYDTWYHNEVIVDLDNDWCEFYLDGAFIIGYQWTLGTFGTAGANTLASTNLYANPGAGGTPPGAHFDDMCFGPAGPPPM
ncbi:GEVED domain-containing protein, partial [Desulfosarcina sp.]|nr:GEVED domain-containing protein [Desulfosarcina sp.]